MSGTVKLNAAQEKARDYMKDHRVESVVSEMLNSLVHSKDPQPMIFMVRELNKPLHKVI